MRRKSSYTPPRRSRAPPLDEVGRIRQNVYEVFQVKPRSSMQRDVPVKNDGGSQLTFVDPALFAYGLKAGFITRKIIFAPEEMLGKEAHRVSTPGTLFGDEGLQRSARVLGLCRSAGISQPAVE
jgi:hypothetical protein